MNSLARSALVLFTALPMLASPGWCCVGWAALCGPMQLGHAHPVSEASASVAAPPAVPACCAQRAAASTKLAGGDSLGIAVEAGPCVCCEDARTAAVAPVLKSPLAGDAAVLVCWTPLAALAAGDVSPVDITLQASGRPLRILQCVWRC